MPNEKVKFLQNCIGIDPKDKAAGVMRKAAVGRSCVHCGLTYEGGCRCKWKTPKHYTYKHEMYNQSSDVTVKEMVETIRKSFVVDHRRCTFKLVVNMLD